MPYEWSDDAGSSPTAAGSVVVSSFPSAGLAATVAAHYIVQALALPRVGTFASPEVPPIAVVQAGRVNPAIRVYGRPGLSVVLSEFPPLPSSTRGLAEAILRGAEARRARIVIGLEGVMPHPAEPDPNEKAEESVWAVVAKSDPGLTDRFERAGAHALRDGVLGGVSGALLVGGSVREVPVAVLLVSSKVNEGYPDHRAGAALIEVLDRFLPELSIDTKPLRTQAALIERSLRAAMKQGERGARTLPDPSEPTIYQ
jgi:predicted ATP-grasp superfamily ATP-dependent carboligase